MEKTYVVWHMRRDSKRGTAGAYLTVGWSIHTKCKKPEDALTECRTQLFETQEQWGNYWGDIFPLRSDDFFAVTEWDNQTNLPAYEYTDKPLSSYLPKVQFQDYQI